MKSQVIIFVFAAILFCSCKSSVQPVSEEPIRAYNIDFNWGEGGPNGFAKP